MNAVIALSHFCELHGPSILFCTQPFHCSNHTPEEISKGATASPSACGISQNKGYDENLIEEPTSQINEATKVPVQRTSSKNKNSTCEACRSLQSGDPGYICIDNESHISYISMQYPEDRELYSVLRHACVRSLSCEVCPGREGPIMFGDEASGYVFSYTFFLKDMQSRGFQRWYSLICVMMDRIYLANLWQFLVRNFKGIIEEMQLKAEKVYKAEVAEKPTRDVLLQPRNAFLTPDQFRRARGGLKYRSLVDITKDQGIFMDLHKTFTWILKASGMRFTEKHLEGPPVEGYLYDEDELSSTIDQLEEFSLQNESSDGPLFESIPHMFQIFGEEKFCLIAFHIVRGDQLIIQGSLQRTIVSAFNVLKNLIPAGCYSGNVNATSYQDAFRYNFLGLPDGESIPSHIINSQLYVLIQVSSNQQDDEIKSKSHLKMSLNSFDSITFKVTGSPVMKEPTYLKHVIEALNNELVDHDTFTVMLMTLKEQWMGKVKVMFRFSKTGVKTTEEKDRLLRILHANAEDEILLKYWMTSLSRSYRNQLLNFQENKVKPSIPILDEAIG